MIIYCNELTLASGYAVTDLVYYKDSLLTQPYSLSDYLGNGIGFQDDPSIPGLQNIYSLYQDHTRVGYRLPTEVEWEYAYKDSSSMDEMGWVDGESVFKTSPVGEDEPNIWGLYDMSGNVWEWCNHECFEGVNHITQVGGSLRVLRGGCWGYGAYDERDSLRLSKGPSEKSASAGFRMKLQVIKSCIG